MNSAVERLEKRGIGFQEKEPFVWKRTGEFVQ